MTTTTVTATVLTTDTGKMFVLLPGEDEYVTVVPVLKTLMTKRNIGELSDKLWDWYHGLTIKSVVNDLVEFYVRKDHGTV